MKWTLTQNGEEATLISDEFAKHSRICSRVANLAINGEATFELTEYDHLSEKELVEMFGPTPLYDSANFFYDQDSGKVVVRSYKYA